MKTHDLNGSPLSSSVPDSFFLAYVECALWSSTYGEDGEERMDDGQHDLSDSAKNQMLRDCADFLAYCEEIGLDPFPEGESLEQSGHDFWLTRNRHGAGYWDRGLATGRALSDAAHTFGSCDLYVGDDDEIHAA